MKYSELTIDEQDLIAMIRRMEGRVGEDQTQLVVFEGPPSLANLVQQFILSLKQCEQTDYEGSPGYITLYIPEEEELREQYREYAFRMVNALFDNHSKDVGTSEEE